MEAVLLVIFFEICYYYEKYVHACEYDSRNIFRRQISAGDAGVGHTCAGMRSPGWAGALSFKEKGCLRMLWHEKEGRFSARKGGWLRRRAEWGVHRQPY